jgi:hypothetical protein
VLGVATLDQLSDEQRAIIELVLKQGKTYAELSDVLALPESRVRELARDALVDLAPVSAHRVEEDWRGQLGDYILGQQSGSEATATRGHLRHSEAARTWARSLLDSLDGFYANGDMPAIPEGERTRGERRLRAPAAVAAASGGGGRVLSPAAQAAVKRRRLFAGAGLLATLLLVGLLLWPVGLLNDDDDDGGGGAESAAAAGQGRPAAGGTPAGIAVIAKRQGKFQLIVTGSKLRPGNQREAYEVWLYNTPKDSRSVGAQVTDAQGGYQGAGPLPAGFERYKFIDVSLEPIDKNAGHSGQSVLRGRMPKLRAVNPKKGQAAVAGQVVLTPPSG